MYINTWESVIEETIIKYEKIIFKVPRALHNDQRIISVMAVVSSQCSLLIYLIMTRKRLYGSKQGRTQGNICVLTLLDINSCGENFTNTLSRNHPLWLTPVGPQKGLKVGLNNENVGRFLVNLKVAFMPIK